jgi:hypothetical protein
MVISETGGPPCGERSAERWKSTSIALLYQSRIGKPQRVTRVRQLLRLDRVDFSILRQYHRMV